MKATATFVAALLIGATLQAAPRSSSTGNSPKVNVNSATLVQLMMLPGVGKVMAQRILDYRAAHGQFHQARDLRQVKGIGEKKLAAMMPFVAVSGPTTATRKIRPCSVNETGQQCQERVGDGAEVIFYPDTNLNLIEAR